MAGILGKKLGMTQVWAEDGRQVTVTAIEAGPCPILAVKEKSLQLGFDPVSDKRLGKPAAGFFKKLNISARRFIREVPKDAAKEYKVGDELKADLFQSGDYVDITGISKGKGFQGGMKRWNWSGGPMTHGSMSHRRIGSIGSTTTPGRVWKGHHLPGRMGTQKTTVQNLLVVRADSQNNILLVRGAVPGNKNSYLVVNKSKKKTAKPPKASPAADKKKKK